MDTTLDEFENGGGSEQFTNNLADSLGVDASLIEITDVREGSVIVTFNVANDGSQHIDDLEDHVASTLET